MIITFENPSTELICGAVQNHETDTLGYFRTIEGKKVLVNGEWSGAFTCNNEGCASIVVEDVKAHYLASTHT